MARNPKYWRGVAQGKLSEQKLFDDAERELARLDLEFDRRKASAAAIGIPFDETGYWITVYRRIRGRVTWLDQEAPTK